MFETRDLEFVRNDSLQFKVEVTEGLLFDDDSLTDPVDLSAYTYDAEVRSDYDSDVVLSTATFDATDEAIGVLTVIFTSLDDYDFPVDSLGVWDLQLRDGAATPNVFTVFRGAVSVVDDVTRV